MPVFVAEPKEYAGLAAEPLGTNSCGLPQFEAPYFICHCVPAVPHPAAIEAVAAAVQVKLLIWSVKATPEAFHVAVWFMKGFEIVIVPCADDM
jgi:hypothetical protein